MSRWPISLTFEIDDKAFQKYIKDAIKRGKDIRPALKQSGMIMIRSFADNFKAEGRPIKWKTLSENTVAQRRKRSSRVLQDTGRLRISTISRMSEGNIYDLKRYELKMGTSLDTGAWHQFGVKPYVISPRTAPVLAIPIPGDPIFATKFRHPGLEPRPFVLIQPEDETAIANVFADYMVGE